MGTQMAKLQRDRRGFTLIELLIVIVIIGVLAGIAILAFQPFEQSAARACEDANERIAEGVDAATAIASRPALQDLGLTEDDFVRGGVDALDCEVVTAGAGGFTASVVQSQDSSVNSGTQTVNLASSPTADNLLVAVGASRAGAPIDPAPPSGGGWTRHALYSLNPTDGNKTIAVWTKQAGASEPTTITWDAQSDGALIVREYAVSGLSLAASDTGAAGSAPLTLGPVSGGSGPGLVIAGAMVRGETSITWSGVGNPTSVAGQGGSTNALVTLSTAHQVVSNASSDQSPTAGGWTSGAGGAGSGAAGFVIILQP